MNLNIKQFFSGLLRTLHLLSFAEKLRFRYYLIKYHLRNQKYKIKNPNLVYPPIHFIYETFGRTSYELFFESGKQAAKSIKEIYRSLSDNPSPTILEWGCGIGRIITHIKDEFPDSKIFGSDVDSKMIEWCKKVYKNIIFIKNDYHPPFSFSDDYFDFVYAASVFTHLTEIYQKEWLEEILRILKPGGYFLFTVHGDYYAHKKLTASEMKRYEAGDIIVRANVKLGSRIMAVFQGEKFMRNILLKNYNIVKHIKETDYQIAGSQEIWIIRK
ncbi:MAG: methyltransferase domain-containing protein [Candidatus Kapabacteria bacterium]|nr:methyltransferase domain-containing protein [Candidatus Kapabacteria bacterium]